MRPDELLARLDVIAGWLRGGAWAVSGTTQQAAGKDIESAASTIRALEKQVEALRRLLKEGLDNDHIYGNDSEQWAVRIERAIHDPERVAAVADDHCEPCDCKPGACRGFPAEGTACREWLAGA